MDQALWFLSRGTGLVSLLLLTGTVAVGLGHAARAGSPAWPRFARGALHRNLSLLAVCFVAVHAASAIIDPYAGLRWVDAVLPFGSDYHPFWLGLGALALDLMLAVVLTSLLRARIGRRAWRAVHVAGYALWPIAAVHGWGISGRDSELSWVLVLYACCAAALGLALWRRLRAREHPDQVVRRSVDAGWR